ncbi:hypothetical protein ACWDE0_30490 [Streptomyces sp. 900105755]
MHPVQCPLTTTAAVLAASLSAAPPVPAASLRATPCTSTWRAVQKIAVRKPAWNQPPVATTRSPIVRYLRKGEEVRSCVVGVGRDVSQYWECAGGMLWRIVPGRQMPAGWLERA